MRFVKAFLLVFAILILTIPPLTACSQAAQPQETDDRMQIVTSFYVLYDLAGKIGGEHVVVTNLVPPGTEPHDWEPGAADLIRLEQADMLIFNGAGMEHWLDKVITALSNQDLILVQTTDGMTLLSADSAHDEEGFGEEEDHDSDGQFDPHVWLDPLNALHQLDLICAALVAADPEHADDYNQAYEQYSAELIALDLAFRQGLAELPRREIIVAHEAFGYMAQAYDLHQVGIEGLSSESEPDPARMAEIVDFARQHDVQVIFFEELASPKVAEAIAREIGARTAVLNPLEGLTKEQIVTGEDYFSVMRQNLDALIDALS
ncbi:MAG: metal ABC transporter substrate-binding protein [Bacillota bacterium]|nr:metal ABC transporter substrate-binding protein [Bacillota bacterium]